MQKTVQRKLSSLNLNAERPEYATKPPGFDSKQVNREKKKKMKLESVIESS